MIIAKQTKNKKEAEHLIPPINFELINVLSWKKKESKYYELSPYFLKTDNKGIYPEGIIFENLWQGSKIYEYVYDIEVYPHFMHKGNLNQLWWKYKCKNKSEQHLIDNNITSEWYNWRNSLWNCEHPIRYPNGINRRKLCKFSVKYERNLSGELIEKRLDYI